MEDRIEQVGGMKTRSAWAGSVATLAIAAASTACAPPGGPATRPMAGMEAPPPAGVASVPPHVTGYAEGQEIRFIHTEASDPVVAQTLSAMMGSPVLLVPSLAQAPTTMLANVYVFANGVKGDGPLGFQADVFDHPPGTEGYRPLRAVHLVSWRDPGAARELRWVAEVQGAAARGDLGIERLGVVVNMPFVTWPGGQR